MFKTFVLDSFEPPKGTPSWVLAILHDMKQVGATEIRVRVGSKLERILSGGPQAVKAA